MNDAPRRFHWRHSIAPYILELLGHPGVHPYDFFTPAGNYCIVFNGVVQMPSGQRLQFFGDSTATAGCGNQLKSFLFRLSGAAPFPIS
jgi:hypothetical protein